MSAPALVALAHGSRDPRAAATISALTDVLACMRPDLTVRHAFMEISEPTLDAVIDELIALGHDEIVIVPLLFASNSDVVVNDHPGVRIEVTEPLGLDAAIFGILDQRLREALRTNRVTELDGLVLAGAGSTDPLANAAVARAARAWGKRHHLPTIAAFAAAAPPAAGEAVRQLREDGRRHVAVGMLFLAPGRLTDRVTELAIEAGAIAVAQPLGVHDELAAMILARYSVGAVHMVPLFV